ncbi:MULTISPECIES: choloylglycine hydrolase [unclassified Exiguobacterium]|uniref:choloylglycine hydrolase n=1 Tax=unclassified Exiguobacterium TaxID=2644629 RepID=UPI00103DF8D7|nr:MULTISPECIES: choloylglycine hydrolase [unclassified Exiguobacterium]TCI43095.1 choloylglycine hydrolase family protein [Exiguobacterium sp. SH5S32]TCI49880.1 choloylglycine hydrolase family protein [Exiguobacterium sp. SH1S4]TCI68116.1 choloylglycine hydrolase family protein [Exiguobacterium sp. SH1S1]
MCTAITYSTKDHYFGRNLDLNVSYHEQVTITPRNYLFTYRRVGDVPHHYAMIGMATVVDDYPLYYEATNETGLSMAGLNFPGNADFKPEASGLDNVTPFEFIPWILGQCATVGEAKQRLETINLVNIDFSNELRLHPLHWMIADQQQSIVVEPLKNGLRVYDNPVGVLTNNPSFDYQLFNLNDYRHVSTKLPDNTFAKALDLEAYCLGLGGHGLPGDLSSTSRFVRATFARFNSISGQTESESVSQFFKLLDTVMQTRGLNEAADGTFEYTIYSSCCNMDRGIYYYQTYENSQITAVSLFNEDLDGTRLIAYPLVTGQQIHYAN